jgi:hypothetical protein
MFDSRPLRGALRIALSMRLAIVLGVLVLMYVAARVRALDDRLPQPGSVEMQQDMIPLQRAHAHNDFEHRHPLFDALARGFSSVEADVWFAHGQLLVAHHYWSVSPSRTLGSLYLEPLRRRVADNQGSVYRGSPASLQLLIDVKSGAEDTYLAIHAELARYASMLTRFEHGAIHRGAVTAIISGDCPRELMATQALRFAACDGRIEDLGTPRVSLLPLISDRWSSLFDWEGNGPMPSAQRTKLLHITHTAHARGQKVRFWATPEAPRAQAAVWSELLAAQVDFINTDALDALRGFLIQHDLPSLLGAPTSSGH